MEKGRGKEGKKKGREYKREEETGIGKGNRKEKIWLRKENKIKENKGNKINGERGRK